MAAAELLQLTGKKCSEHSLASPSTSLSVYLFLAQLQDLASLSPVTGEMSCLLRDQGGKKKQ